MIQIDKGVLKLHPYHKLHEASDTSILVETKQGMITIIGKNLFIQALDQHEIWIKGEMKQVSFT